MAFSVMVIDPLRPRSCPRFRFGGVSSGVFVLRSPVPLGACLSARLSLRHRGKVHTRSIPVGRVYSIVKEQEEKDPLTSVAEKNGIFTKK